jgi:phage tail sheath gpL-like
VSGLTTAGLARNDPHMTILGYNLSPTPIWAVLGSYVGQSAVVLRNDPARPVQDLEIPGMIAPPIGTGRFAQSERNTLLYSGISTFVVGPDGVCRIERLISTYQQNSNGQPSEAWLSVEKSFTLMRVLRRLQAVWLANFPRHKLAPDGTRFRPGSAIVTPALAKGFTAVEMRNMEADGLLMDVSSMIPLLTCEINAQNPDRLDVLFPPPLIGQLRMTAVLAQFRINTN